MELCKHHELCGGCLYQGLPYEEQVLLKGKEVLRLLSEHEIPVGRNLGITGSPRRTAYRNKMEYTFGDETKGGVTTLGMHKRGNYMSIVTTEECQLVDPDFNRILSATLDFARYHAYPHYHKKSHQGLLRNLIVRKGERTSELLINLVTTSQVDWDREGFVNQILSLELGNQVIGILHTVNDGASDAVNCDALHTLWGRDYYMEKIMGLDFVVSAFSFFQTNVEAVETLYREAIDLIPDLAGKTVFDLYCGTGTITQALACAAEQVTGIELSEEAVQSARINAEKNGLTNCSFIAGDVFEVLQQLDEKPDVIVLDPPRSGVHPKAMEKILQYQTSQILYISCNPKTLMENLKQAMLHGYVVDQIKAYDNFPFTRHIEACALLVR